MDWCVDTRVPGARSAAETEIALHLVRHALDPTVVELARPLVAELVRQHDGQALWLNVDWESQMATLRAAPLPTPGLLGEMVGPGLARAHEHAEVLGAGGAEGLTVELGIARAPEGDLDPGPAPPELLSPSQPLSLVGLISAAQEAGATLEVAAARAGATVAARAVADGNLRSDSGSIADAVVTLEEKLGGDFRVVTATGSRVVLHNRRCPFGPLPPPGLCRFTSSVAGSLGAALAGSAEVSLDERLALGDHQCRLVLDLGGPPSGRLTSHRYTSPPAGLPSEEAAAPGSFTRGFRVTLTLQLPRDRLSVPVTRHLVRAALIEVGVVADDVAPVELALTEACANVVNHSGPGDAYDVAVTIDPGSCHIRVIDVGRGFDHHAFSPAEMANVDAEHGRGVALMHALVDQVRFESQPESGTVVHLVKRLRFDDRVPARRLMLQDFGDDAPA